MTTDNATTTEISAEATAEATKKIAKASKASKIAKATKATKASKATKKIAKATKASKATKGARKPKTEAEVAAASEKRAEEGLPFAELVRHNAISRKSTTKSPCEVVWDTAFAMKGAPRKEVLAACIEKGVAYYTARTQYQQWRQAGAKAKAKA